MATQPTPAIGWEIIAARANGPGPRSRHGLTYDRRANAAVLFGGIVWDSSQGTYQSDTWELHDRQWIRIDTADTPPARHRGAMVYLANLGQSLLFGGQGHHGGLRGKAWSGFHGDTWLYSGRQWREVRPVGTVPSPRCGHCLAFDEQHGVAVLFGGIDPDDNSLGDTWLFDGTSWKAVAGSGPPARRYAAFAYDPDLKGCLLHGGAEDDQGRQTFGDAWLFRDNAWTPLGKAFATEPRDDHGLAYHRTAGRLVLLEGLAGQRGLLVREETGWHALEASSLHPRHQCSPLAWDDALGGLLLHGGEARHGGPQFDMTLLLRIPPARARSRNSSAAPETVRTAPMTDIQPPRRERPAILLLLWAILCLIMWFWAIAGPLFVVLGALSFFIDLNAIGISLSGPDDEPIRTTTQKIVFTATSALIGTVGITFLWLRKRGYLKYGGIE
jgi:hypothetical protein